MYNSNTGERSFPRTKIFTDNNSDRRAASRRNGQGRLATEDLRRLVAAMID